MMRYDVTILNSAVNESKAWLLDRGYDHTSKTEWLEMCRTGEIPREKAIGSYWLNYKTQGIDSDIVVMFHENFKADAMEFKLIFGVKSVIDVY